MNCTLYNIPASARAVYAPRENPSNEITASQLPSELPSGPDEPNKQTLSPTL